MIICYLEIWVCTRIVDSASNRNEYQEDSCGGKAQPACEADKFTAICEPIV
jgi:hypothetical protein